jgi:CDP-glucose 4,6-dehydratase
VRASRRPFSETDIRDAAALAETVAAHRPDVILHLAAQADVRLSVADPRPTRPST